MADTKQEEVNNNFTPPKVIEALQKILEYLAGEIKNTTSRNKYYAIFCSRILSILLSAFVSFEFGEKNKGVVIKFVDQLKLDRTVYWGADDQSLFLSFLANFIVNAQTIRFPEVPPGWNKFSFGISGFFAATFALVPTAVFVRTMVANDEAAFNICITAFARWLQLTNGVLRLPITIQDHVTYNRSLNQASFKTLHLALIFLMGSGFTGIIGYANGHLTQFDPSDTNSSFINFLGLGYQVLDELPDSAKFAIQLSNAFYYASCFSSILAVGVIVILRGIIEAVKNGHFAIAIALVVAFASAFSNLADLFSEDNNSTQPSNDTHSWLDAVQISQDFLIPIEYSGTALINAGSALGSVNLMLFLFAWAIDGCKPKAATTGSGALLACQDQEGGISHQPQRINFGPTSAAFWLTAILLTAESPIALATVCFVALLQISYCIYQKDKSPTPTSQKRSRITGKTMLSNLTEANARLKLNPPADKDKSQSPIVRAA